MMDLQQRTETIERFETMTPEELRSQMSPEIIRKVRSVQLLGAIFLVFTLLSAALAVAEIVKIVEPLLTSSGLPALSTKVQLFSYIGGMYLAGFGVSWCRHKASGVVKREVERMVDDAERQA